MHGQIQTFYNNLAAQYDKLFLNWQDTTRQQAEILEKIFKSNGYDCAANILDCACGIGTQADFHTLSDTFSEKFDVIIAMDNALPHMLTAKDLAAAIKSIVNQIEQNGIFVASIRDYDSLLDKKPPYSPPYIHKTDEGQRVSFQTWEWKDENYKLTQYIVEDEESLQVSKFECE